MQWIASAKYWYLRSTTAARLLHASPAQAAVALRGRLTALGFRVDSLPGDSPGSLRFLAASPLPALVSLWRDWPDALNVSIAPGDSPLTASCTLQPICRLPHKNMFAVLYLLPPIVLTVVLPLLLVFRAADEVTVFGAMAVLYTGWSFMLTRLPSHNPFVEQLFVSVEREHGYGNTFRRSIQLAPLVLSLIAVAFLIATAIAVLSIASQLRFFLILAFTLALAAGLIGGLLFAQLPSIALFSCLYGTLFHIVLIALATFGFFFGPFLGDVSVAIESFAKGQVSWPAVLVPCFPAALGIGFLIISVRWLSRLTKKGIQDIGFHRRHAPHVPALPPARLGVGRWTVALLWLFLTVAYLLALLVAVAHLRWSLVGSSEGFLGISCPGFYSFFLTAGHHLLPASLAGLGTLLAKAIVFAMALPALLVGGLLIVRMAQTSIDYRRCRRLAKAGPQGDARATATLEQICRHAGMPPPLLSLHTSDALSAGVLLPPVPGLRPVLQVSSGAVARLSEEELAALLAHEVGHIRGGHVFWLGLLNFLSKTTLATEGFLSLLYRPPLQLEAEADRFAVHYLEHASVPAGRQALVDVLRRIQAEALIGLHSSFQDGSLRASFPLTSADWLPASQQAVFGAMENAPRWRQACFLLTHGWMAVYTHQPLDQRIAAINAQP